MNIAIKIIGIMAFVSILYAVLSFLNKKGVVSDEALAGKETKPIRIAKLILLAIVIISILIFLVMYLMNS
jgi:hypothetical protein